MMLTRLSLGLSLLLLACSTQKPKPHKEKEVALRPVDGLSARRDGDRLTLSLVTMTGGFHLRLLDARTGDDGRTVVRLVLTTPGDGAIVTQAIVTHRVEAKVGSGAVLVKLQRVQRGRLYEVQPEFEPVLDLA